jgi:hypothetical protein
VRLFQRADGSAASSALALDLAPSELMAIDGDGNLVSITSDVATTVSADDVRRITLPSGASGIVPYSFVARRLSSTLSFAGEVTFSFRIPIQPNAEENPATISVLFLIVQNVATASTP